MRSLLARLRGPLLRRALRELGAAHAVIAQQQRQIAEDNLARALLVAERDRLHRTLDELVQNEREGAEKEERRAARVHRLRARMRVVDGGAA